MLCWCSLPIVPQTASTHKDHHLRPLQPSSSMLLTTYQRDFIPLTPVLLPSAVRSSAEGPPAGQHTTLQVPWPAYTQHFYRSTNSTYGSFQEEGGVACPVRHTDGWVTESPVFYTTMVALPQREPESLDLGTGLQQRAADSLGTGLQKGAVESPGPEPLLGLDAQGQLMYVFGEADVSENMDKEDKQPPLEEGAIIVSSHVGVACCEDFLQSVYRKAGLEDQFQTPQDVTHITSAEWESSPQWKPFKQDPAAAGTRLHPHSSSSGGGVWMSDEGPFQTLPSPAPPRPPPVGSRVPMVPRYSTAPRPQPRATPLLSQYFNKYICDWPRP